MPSLPNWVGPVLLFGMCAGAILLNYKYTTTVERHPVKYTIRVNTFRRNDLLKQFLDHYTTCPEVEQVTVVWSDPDNKPPPHLGPDAYPHREVFYEIHETNSITNRFRALNPVPTDAVLSVDEDVLLPCSSLRKAHLTWASNSDTLVGFPPRLHAFNPESGAERYLKWQHTWWNGAYSIMLTKACFLHKKYLSDFFEIIPESIVKTIHENRNCEDIAMAHVVAMKSKKPPVWVKAVVHEMSIDEGGISSRAGHFEDRSHCLGMIREATGYSWPWKATHQKSISLSFTDIFTLFSDRK